MASISPNAIQRLELDGVTFGTQILALNSAIKNFKYGNSSTGLALGVALVNFGEKVGMIIVDIRNIIKTDPELNFYSGIFNGITILGDLGQLFSDLVVVGNQAQRGHITLSAKLAVAADAGNLIFDGISATNPQVRGATVILSIASSIFSDAGAFIANFTGLKWFVVKEPAIYTATTGDELSGAGVLNTIITGTESFSQYFIPTQFAAEGSAGDTLVQGIPQPDMIDTLVGNATFIGESGADTFIMNGALIARGTTGPTGGGGSGNTYMIPISTAPYSDGGNVQLGSGTIEGQGAGNVVMLGGQQLTTLMVYQYEDPSASSYVGSSFFTNVPIAEGVTNTGQAFLLIEDNPGTASEYNMSDNPHNGESVDFELYIFPTGFGVAFDHVDDSFGAGSDDAGQQLQQDADQAATAHITFASGDWSDYGITVEDDTGSDPTELGVNPVPGDFLQGPGDGPPIPGATDQVGQDDEEDDDSDITVSAGTTLTVSAGSAVSTLTVSAGGYVLGGGSLLGASGDAGVISGVTVGQAGSAGSSGYVEVSAGGSAINVTVVNGAVTIDSGGYASGVMLSGASATLVVAGVAVGTVVGSGSFDFVETGGVASGSIISNGGVEYVASGGVVVSAAVVDSAAVDSVRAGGSDSGSVISNGGIEDAIGGLVSGAQVLSGGLEILNPGATADHSAHGWFTPPANPYFHNLLP
jgi:hypothetical protein